MRARGWSQPLVAVVFACVPWLLAVPSAVAGQWLFRAGFSVPTSRESHPAVAMNSSGEAAIAFATNGERVSLRPAEGDFEYHEWGGVQVSESGVTGEDPAVAIDTRGDVVAVWTQATGANPQIYAAIRAAGSSFGAPVAVSPATEAAETASVGISDAGEATVAWVADGVVRTASATLAGSFGASTALSGKGANAGSVHVAVDSAGAAIVSWVRDGELETSTRPAGGDFPEPGIGGEAEQLGSVADSSTPRVLIDASGEALAVWRNPAEQVRAAWQPAGGSFAPPEALGTTSGEADAALNSGGEAVAAWPVGSGTDVDTGDPGGPFGSPEYVASAWGAGFLAQGVAVAIGVSGNIAIESEEVEASGNVWQGTWRQPGGSFAPIEGLFLGAPEAAGSLATAGDSAGDLLGVWSDSSDGEMSCWLYDAGPQIGPIAARSSATVGEPVDFSVAEPESAWKPLKSIEWNFGDGATAEGATVAHGFTKAGTYEVTATASDGQYTGLVDMGGILELVSNSVSHTVTVLAAPAPPSAPAARAALTGLRLARSAFGAASSGPDAVASIERAGTTARFGLTAAATVLFAVERTEGGRREQGRCVVVGVTARVPETKRCTFQRRLGSFDRAGHAGQNAFRLTGRLGGEALRAGSYVLVARIKGSSEHDRQARFRIVPR